MTPSTQSDPRCTFPLCICTAEQRNNDCPGFPPRRRLVTNPSPRKPLPGKKS